MSQYRYCTKRKDSRQTVEYLIQVIMGEINTNCHDFLARVYSYFPSNLMAILNY